MASRLTFLSNLFTRLRFSGQLLELNFANPCRQQLICVRDCFGVYSPWGASGGIDPQRSIDAHRQCVSRLTMTRISIWASVKLLHRVAQNKIPHQTTDNMQYLRNQCGCIIKVQWIHSIALDSEKVRIKQLQEFLQDAQLSQRDRAAGCVIVFAKSRRLELGDNILRTL